MALEWHFPKSDPILIPEKTGLTLPALLLNTSNEDELILQSRQSS